MCHYSLVGYWMGIQLYKKKVCKGQSKLGQCWSHPCSAQEGALGSSGPLQPDFGSGSGTWAILPNRGSLFKTRRPSAASGRCLQQKEMAHIGKIPFSPLTRGCPLFSCLTLCSTRAASASAGSAVRRGRGHERTLCSSPVFTTSFLTVEVPLDPSAAILCLLPVLHPVSFECQERQRLFPF